MGAQTLSGGSFRGNATNRARFTAKTTREITAQFGKSNSFGKLDYNSERFAPIGLGGGGGGGALKITVRFNKEIPCLNYAVIPNASSRYGRFRGKATVGSALPRKRPSKLHPNLKRIALC